jgi:hypothetical protein
LDTTLHGGIPVTTMSERRATSLGDALVPGLQQAGGHSSVEVVDRHLIAGGKEIGGEVAADVSQPDSPDSQRLVVGPRIEQSAPWTMVRSSIPHF